MELYSHNWTLYCLDCLPPHLDPDHNDVKPVVIRPGESCECGNVHDFMIRDYSE